MNENRTELLSCLELGGDGIYGYSFDNKDQAQEVELRESVANHVYGNYWKEISNHHSIPVMDKEVNRFLINIPENGLIIDVGGCWGWHWRKLQNASLSFRFIFPDEG